MRVSRLVTGATVLGLAGIAALAARPGTAVEGVATVAGPEATICPADVDADGVVMASDIAGVVAAWGSCHGCAADLDGDGAVGLPDLVEVLEALGGCGAPMLPVGGTHVCAVEDGSFVTADGGCKDLATGIVWGIRHGSDSWPVAVDFVAGSTEASFTDWRLPTKDEWLAVAAHGAATHFGAGYENPFNPFWTSTTQGNKAWGVTVAGVATKFQKIDFIYTTGVRVPPPPGSPCNNNSVCEPGENCENCGGDCPGQLTGPPSGRYCCGNGVAEPAEAGLCDGNP